MRVSVVATGIDVATSARQPAPQTRQAAAPVAVAPTPVPQAAAPQPAPQAVAAASRLAELTQTLRANTAPSGRTHPARRSGAARGCAGARGSGYAPQPVMQYAPEPVFAEAPIEAPVALSASTITAIEDVTIRPMTPKPSLFVEPVEQMAEPAPPAG